MSGTMEEQLDRVLDTHLQRRRQHEAERLLHQRAIGQAHAELERMQEKFFLVVRSKIEQAVDRANRHLARRSERCQLAEVSGYFTGPLYVGGSACNPIAYELRIDGREVGETLIVELTHEGMIEASLGPFRPSISEGHTTRLDLGWSAIPLDLFETKCACDLVVRYVSAITSRWPLGAMTREGWHPCSDARRP